MPQSVNARIEARRAISSRGLMVTSPRLPITMTRPLLAKSFRVVREIHVGEDSVPDGFAFVPHTCRFLGRSSSGCRNDSEGDAIFADTRSDHRSIAPPRSLLSSFLPRAARQCIRLKRIPLAPRVITTTVQMRPLCQSQWQ
jgi:hypothetical protein